MALLDDPNYALDLGIPTLGNQRANDPTADPRGSERRRAHEGGVKVALEPAAVDGFRRSGKSRQRGDHEIGARRPAAVDGRFVDAGLRGDVFDPEPGIAPLAEDLERRAQNG